MKVYVGEYTGQDLKTGKDKKDITVAQEKDTNKRNGIKYIVSKYSKKTGTMKVWLSDRYEDTY